MFWGAKKNLIIFCREGVGFSQIDALEVTARDQMNQMLADIDNQMADYEAEREAEKEFLKGQMKLQLEYVKKKPIETETKFDAGASIGIDGSFLQPNSWTESIRNAEVDDDWGEDIGASREPMFKSTSLGKKVFIFFHTENI